MAMEAIDWNRPVRWWDTDEKVMIESVEKGSLYSALPDGLTPMAYITRFVASYATGTPDRHGDMIFDHDILSIPERGEIFEVKMGWCGMDGHAIGMFKPGAHEGKRIDRMGQVTERIGNTFENAALLKKYV